MEKQELEKLIDQRVEALKQELLSKFETKLPDTGWVIAKGGSIVYKTGLTSGFGYWKYTENWFNSNVWDLADNPNDWHVATPEEMETKVLPMLKVEAKNRGYKEGVDVKCLFNNEKDDIISNHVVWSKSGLWYGECLILNTQGEWAEIITEPKEMFVNMYDNGNITYVGNAIHNSKEEAVNIGKVKSDTKYLGTYRLTKID